jgi:hypothetical protein
MSALSFASMPPLFVPLRFFLVAPWFGILASVLFLFNGEAISASRWSVETLAFTHLLTIGFMLMGMTGALFQFIPVITGYSIPGSKKISPIIFFAMIFGILFLVVAFLTAKPLFFQLAIIFFVLSFGLFFLAFSYLLITINSEKEAIFIIRLVNIALFITMGLGILMTFAYAFERFSIPFRIYTNMHMLWGVLGWTILLIMAVSSQIIPMFHVTPVFSPAYLKSLSIALITCLVLFTIIDLIGNNESAQIWVKVILSGIVLMFSSYTLFMLNKRKRKVKDITVNFWRLALVMPIIAIFLYWFNDKLLHIPLFQLELLLGLLFIFGLAISSIMGMMQKIVPFIIYMHLQTMIVKSPQHMGLLPNMQTLISFKHQQIQFYLHVISLLLLTFCLFFNSLIIPAAIVMLVDFSWLSYSLLYSTRQYLNISKVIKN